MENTVPENANQACPGTESNDAGKSDACAGCPNQSICANASFSIPNVKSEDLDTADAWVKKICLDALNFRIHKPTFSGTHGLVFARMGSKEAAQDRVAKLSLAFNIVCNTFCVVGSLLCGQPWEFKASNYA